MSDLHSKIDELLGKRAQIDAELVALKDLAQAELEQAQAKFAAVTKALGKSEPVLAAPRRPTELDETDAGRGVREEVDNTSADDFRGELHVLRQRSLEKRARREH